MEGSKEEYKKFFDAKLKKFGVNSPAELKGADKKKFYDEIDKEWNADHEDGEDGVKEWKKAGETNRRCSGGDKRRKANRVVASEEDDCEDDEEKDENLKNFGDKKAKPFKDDDEEEKKEAKVTSYMEHEIEKACKKVKMSPAEIGEFFAILESF